MSLVNELYAARRQMLDAPTGSREYWRAVRAVRSLTPDLPEAVVDYVTGAAKIVSGLASVARSLAGAFRNAFSPLFEDGDCDA